MDIYEALTREDSDAVRRLLDSNDFQQNKNRFLTKAVFTGNPELVEVFLVAKADVNAGNGELLKISIQLLNYYVIDILLKYGANTHGLSEKELKVTQSIIDLGITEFMDSKISIAIRARHDVFLCILLKYGPVPSEKHLRLAHKLHYDEICKTLIKKSCPIPDDLKADLAPILQCIETEKQYSTALEDGDLSTIKRIIESGFEIDLVRSLNIACFKEHLEIIDYFLQKGIILDTHLLRGIMRHRLTKSVEFLRSKGISFDNVPDSIQNEYNL